MKENTNNHSAAASKAEGAVMENHNLIILDRSGSMMSIRKYAVDAVNETIATIRARQEANAADEKSYITFLVFCGCGLQTIYDHVPVEKVKPLGLADYKPCCTTPLYDAIGCGITRLHSLIEGKSAVSNAVQVTIVTDGYENSSHEFSRLAISSLIDAYKKEGWLFVYMGADHDVEKVAYELNIDNSLEFNKTEADVRLMSDNLNCRSSKWRAMRKKMVSACMCKEMTDQEAMDEIKKSNNEFFL